MQNKTLALNLLRTVRYARSDMDFIRNLLGGARHGQPMREEVPVFGNEIEQFKGHQHAYIGIKQARAVSCSR
jgi:hypothetical protein